MPDTTESTTQSTALLPARVWLGRSGQPVTGAAAAAHLDLTLKILDRGGWVRVYTDEGDGGLRGLTKASSFRDMLHGLVVAVRDLVTDGGPRTLGSAMYRADEEGSDMDASYAAMKCMEAAIRARYDLEPTASVCVFAWANRQGRTFDEVRELLTEAADLARTHGPAA
uniref:DUF6197 family protein n=1 Tax=Streptomyces tubercidicus TaxID=47759 RepID=UPI0037DC13BD|nr:hypothetical protein OG690_38460 [Streptomyces tubercidicus]